MTRIKPVALALACATMTGAQGLAGEEPDLPVPDLSAESEWQVVIAGKTPETHLKYRPGPEKHSVMSTRLKLKKTDQMLAAGKTREDSTPGAAR